MARTPDRPSPAPDGLDAALSALEGPDLAEAVRFWSPNGHPVGDDSALRGKLRGWLEDPELVEARFSGLAGRMAAVVDFLRHQPGYRASRIELLGSPTVASMAQRELERCVEHLRRRAMVIWSADPTFTRHGERVLALPSELGQVLERSARRLARGTFDALTLRGHLDRRYSDPAQDGRVSPRRQREMYRLYSKDSAAVSRIERLPEGVRELVEKAILEFGGVLPRRLFERMETSLPHWNAKRWRMILEQSLVGTVTRLDLERYGINHNDETLVVFNEVALAWLKQVAVPGDPDRPHAEAARGVDLVTNIVRFLAYVDENDVRFTVKGAIFKTTERRIVQHLIPNPGRELSREDVFDWIQRFCKHMGLIDSTGERTVAVTPEGRGWADRPLGDQLSAIIDFMVEERGFDGELYHQTRMRRIFLRLLKRVDADIWYDLMYVPFLTRNTYLASLDELAVHEDFEELLDSNHYQPLEDVQRMAWNLVRWVRQRLYLAGAVDLGYDDGGRPVAMRLTTSGARLLGIAEEHELPPRSAGQLVVQPDFEVVLFTSGDDAELIFDLDRFSAREKDAGSMHFRITQESVTRGLRQGMTPGRILDLLDQFSRTPIPQNVRYSIRDWAMAAGWMVVGGDLVVTCKDRETMRRFLRDPGVRGHLGEVLDEERVRLRGRSTPKRMQYLLRDLGYLVELAS